MTLFCAAAPGAVQTTDMKMRRKKSIEMTSHGSGSKKWEKKGDARCEEDFYVGMPKTWKNGGGSGLIWAFHSVKRAHTQIGRTGSTKIKTTMSWDVQFIFFSLSAQIKSIFWWSENWLKSRSVIEKFENKAMLSSTDNAMSAWHYFVMGADDNFWSIR